MVEKYKFIFIYLNNTCNKLRINKVDRKEKVSRK